ncbi:hypothetical protein [Microbacterium sp. KNMS]
MARGSQNRTKDIEKFFRQLGGRRGRRERDGTVWVFPDGAAKFVRDSEPGLAASRAMQWAAERYGQPAPAYEPGERVRRREAPVLDLERVVASEHAKERMALMRRQDGRATFRDLMATLACPVRVVWSETHGSWVWVGGRLAVPVRVRADGSAVILSVLWATGDLWAENPRPERVAS